MFPLRAAVSCAIIIQTDVFFQEEEMNSVLRRLRSPALLLCAIIVVLFFVSFEGSVPKAYAYSEKDENVKYESVEKTIEVSDKKVCTVVETITVRYQRPNINVGLSRNVSRLNKITRIVDGKKYVRKTISGFALKSVTMDGKDEYNFVEKTEDYYYINTGADGDYKAGRHIYRIEYDYDLGEDFISAFDDFTFDVMDYGFRGEVESFSATVTLPFAFNEARLSFRTNSMKTVSMREANAEVYGNIFRCSLSGLAAKQGLTVQLILPNKYFDTEYLVKTSYKAAAALLILCMAAVGVIFIVVHLRNKANTVPTVEYYPPEGFSPIDVAKVVRGKIKPSDFAALAVYWESLGYIKIEFRSKQQLVLKRIKDMPKKKRTTAQNAAHTPYSYDEEQKYFKAIFKDGNEFDTKSRKDVAALRKIRQKAKEVYEVNPYRPFMTAQGIILKAVIHLLSLAPAAMLLCINSTLEGAEALILLLPMIFPLAAMLIVCYLDLPVGARIMLFVCMGGIPLFGLIMNYMFVYDSFRLIYLALIFMAAGNMILPKFLYVRTQENSRLMGKIEGFRHFLLTAELPRMEALLDENPEYFYNVLPYCYVLGITKKMQARFAALNVELSSGGASMSGYSFGRLSHCMGAMSYGGSSSGGGGGGGGGSSGGGGGGGGCGGR